MINFDYILSKMLKNTINYATIAPRIVDEMDKCYDLGGNKIVKNKQIQRGGDKEDLW